MFSPDWGSAIHLFTNTTERKSVKFATEKFVTCTVAVYYPHMIHLIMSRPTKYEQTYAHELIRLAKMGLTKAEICQEIGISKDTLYRWKNDPDKPEFSDAYKRAETLIESWFIRRFKEMAVSGAPPGAVAALIWLSKNCLKWGQNDQTDDTLNRSPLKVVRILPINDKP